MKLVLVRPNVPSQSRYLILPPLGLMYISAAAKKAGHDVEIHDSYLLDENPLIAKESIERHNPDIIGIQVHFNTITWTKEFIDSCRMTILIKNEKFIIGGPYITAVGSKALNETGADVAIIGEFDNLRESTFDNIIKFADMKEYKTGRYKTEPVNVNEIPIPDWESINLPDYWPHFHSIPQPTKGKRIATIQRTRGCRHSCTFCGTGLGKKVRIRDDDNVIEEIKYLKDRWDIDEIWFSDANFLSDYKRAIGLFDKLESLNVHIRLYNGIRIENISPWMVRVMKKAGVYFTSIGIESGNERILKRIKKNIHLGRARDKIRLLNKHGITTMGFFILGLPTETREEMEGTIKYAMSTKLNHAQFGTFLAYPGAEDCNEKSLLPESELIKIQRNATLRFYLRPRIIWGMLKHLRLSQIKAFWNHSWIKRWMGRS